MSDTDVQFTLKNFERIIALWDCTLNQSFFDAEGNFVLPSTCRIVTAPNGQKILIKVPEEKFRELREQYGRSGAATHIIEAGLDFVRDRLNEIGLSGPSSRQSFAMICMFDTLTEAQKQVLNLLPRNKDPVRPGWVGNQLWGNGYRKPQHYARTAGKVLNALRDKGLVIWVGRQPDSPSWGWVLTEAGLEAKES